ncbi:hypothetical protein BGY98DRAFT_991473 [Russula aff. rugulosa BPL654]|nr:hypothetical protein BGY98DRAFT_991473 [Russula aff. rugulosa BPL654]
MSHRIPSLAVPLASLFFFPTFVVAQVVIGNCTLLSYFWTFNSVGQSPCTVADTYYTLAPLATGGTYLGPTLETSNPCECSTVGYSLISACVTCQEGNPLSYTEYTLNCTFHLMPPTQFPNPVPAGVYVPHWAILDVTGENNWNPDESYNAGDTPEYGPGAIFGASGASSSSTAPPTHSHSGSHAGAIAGGIIGGITIISITIAAILFCIRRRSSQAASADVGASLLMPNDGTVMTVTQPSLGPPLTMRIYDPNDPTTFPRYQGGPQYPDIASVSQVPSQVGSRSTPLYMQTSVPNSSGYRGLPMPH